MGAVVDTKEHKKKEKDVKKKKSDKKEKKELLSQLPTHNTETGKLYNKAQKRRMLKRIKRGLSPVPTKAELDEIRKEESKIRKDFALIYQDGDENRDDKSSVDALVDDNNDNDDDDEEMEDIRNVVSEEDEDKEAVKLDDKNEVDNDNMINKDKNINMNKSESTKSTNIVPKQSATKKAVPSNYVCQACQNKNSPLHWIYNCPDKISKEGCNQVKKGTYSPNKIYISGLPFDITTKELRMYLKSKSYNNDNSSTINVDGKFIRYCKLLTFKDSQRCNGQAEIIFQNEDITNKILKLHGTVLDLDDIILNDNKKESTSKRRNMLTLSIKKAPPRKRFPPNK